MTNTSVFLEASRTVKGPRRIAYGPAKESFSRIASMWSVILKNEVTASQVAQCMLALKLIRESNSHSRDNVIDIIGYAGLIEEIET